MRESFVFYSSFAQAASMLGDKARLKLYDAVVKLGLCCAENVTELEQVCSEIETSLVQNRNAFAQFLLIKPQIIANFTRYINGSKGAKYGAFGGAPIGNKNAVKNNPKTTPNENVNVNDNKKEKIYKKEKNKGVENFKKPSVDEVKSYCLERNNGVDAEKFFDFYECKGWKVGKNPMKDWRAAVRNWERMDDSRQVVTTKIADDIIVRTPEQEEESRRIQAIMEATIRQNEERVKARFGV